jgi:CheY-like chemotaxis protein
VTVAFDQQTSVLSAPSRRLPLNLADHRILIIDDNATNRVILKRMLAESAAAVSECSGGQEGLNEIERAKAAGMPYSVVLLDNRMPSMDGFEVAQALRTSSSGLNPLVLMLTSDNRRGDLSRCHALGITRYLVKPIKRVQLLTALSECLAEERLSEQHVAHEKERLPADLASRALRILLVDDSPSNRILIQAYLKHSHHRVEVADNGAVAVEMLLSNTYDLVFMDMQMPVMDGYDATAAVRKRERDLGIPPVPIIALTAAAFKEDQERCLKAGCTAYISKPVRKSAVLNAIHTYTR